MPQVQPKTEKKCDVCVKEHLSNLSSNLNRAQNEESFCDFLIKVGSREFHVHKIILSEGSDYFKGMFSHKMTEMESGVAEIKDVDPDCMDICIEYIYTGKVSVPESKILPLVKAADRFQLTGLHDALLDFVDENLNAESYFMTKDLANQFGLSQLEEKCDKFAKEHFEEISKLDDFKSLDKKTLFSLLSDKGNKASERVKLDSVFQWIQFEPHTRKNILPTLHEKINFSKIPVKFRRKLIEDEPLVCSCSELLRHISLSALDSANVHSEDLPSVRSSEEAETSGSSLQTGDRAQEPKGVSLQREVDAVGMKFGDEANVNLSNCVINVKAGIGEHGSEQLSDVKSLKSEPKIVLDPCDRLVELGIDKKRIYTCDFTLYHGGRKVRKLVLKDMDKGCWQACNTSVGRDRERRINYVLLNGNYVIAQSLTPVGFPSLCSIFHGLEAAFWIDTKSLKLYVQSFSGLDTYFSTSSANGTSWSICSMDGLPTAILSIAKYADWYERCSQGLSSYIPMSGVTVNFGTPDLYDGKLEITPCALLDLKSQLDGLYK